MKRLLLAIVIFTTATSVFCALSKAAAKLRLEAAATVHSLTTQTKLLAEDRIRLTTLEERVRELKRTLRPQPPNAGQPSASPLLSLAGATRLSAGQSEQMLEELGFDWHSTGDYLIVSKETLRAISLAGMQGMKLSGTAADVLAVTPDERARLDALTEGLGEDHQAWVQAHLQREEPSETILAKYSLPAAPEFFQSLSNRFASGIMATLGDERGNLMLNYAYSWMSEIGMNGSSGTTTLTVKSYQSGDDTRLSFVLKTADSSMSTDGSPFQPFPAAFRPGFPNGWVDLASREGFALPKEFEKKSVSP